MKDQKDELMEEVAKRFVAIMDSENIPTVTSFANMLDMYVQRIHNIVHARNLPALDILNKVLIVFPEISADWLISGKGQMYRDGIVVVNGKKKKIKDPRASPEASAELFEMIQKKDDQIEKLIDSVYDLSKAVEKAGLRRKDSLIS